MTGFTAAETASIVKANEVKPGMRIGLFATKMKDTPRVGLSRPYGDDWLIHFTDGTKIITDPQMRLRVWQPIL